MFFTFSISFALPLPSAFVTVKGKISFMFRPLIDRLMRSFEVSLWSKRFVSVGTSKAPRMSEKSINGRMSIRNINLHQWRNISTKIRASCGNSFPAFTCTKPWEFERGGEQENFIDQKRWKCSASCVCEFFPYYCTFRKEFFRWREKLVEVILQSTTHVPKTFHFYKNSSKNKWKISSPIYCNFPFSCRCLVLHAHRIIAAFACVCSRLWTCMLHISVHYISRARVRKWKFLIENEGEISNRMFFVFIFKVVVSVRENRKKVNRILRMFSRFSRTVFFPHRSFPYSPTRA